MPSSFNIFTDHKMDFAVTVEQFIQTFCDATSDLHKS